MDKADIFRERQAELRANVQEAIYGLIQEHGEFKFKNPIWCLCVNVTGINKDGIIAEYVFDQPVKENDESKQMGFYSTDTLINMLGIMEDIIYEKNK